MELKEPILKCNKLLICSQIEEAQDLNWATPNAIYKVWLNKKWADRIRWIWIISRFFPRKLTQISQFSKVDLKRKKWNNYKIKEVLIWVWVRKSLHLMRKRMLLFYTQILDSQSVEPHKLHNPKKFSIMEIWEIFTPRIWNLNWEAFKRMKGRVADTRIVNQLGQVKVCQIWRQT